MRVADALVPRMSAAYPAPASTAAVFRLPVQAHAAAHGPVAAQSVRATLSVAAATLEAIRTAERRRRAIRSGKNVLDALDQLRAAMLGASAGQALSILTKQLEEAGDASGDPALDEVLEHIRLRADVELAKARASARRITSRSA